MGRVELQPAYVLHTREYRDSSLLVELLTPDYGRVSAVVRGARGSGKSVQRKRGAVRPFVPLLVSWSGNADLKSLQQIEAVAPDTLLQGKRLYSALYVNELLVRLLQHYEEQLELFSRYQQTLSSLEGEQPVDVVLRQFELQLMQLLGYGVNLELDSRGKPLIASDYYRYYPDQGFIPDVGADSSEVHCFRGSTILALAAGDYSDDVRRVAKRLCRLALQPHLGDKPLKSRELFL